jgi:hypothetical protein
LLLQEAVKHCEYWRLADSKNKAPGLIGWWPQRAVTFVDNHDTGKAIAATAMSNIRPAFRICWQQPGLRDTVGWMLSGNVMCCSVL